MARKNVSNPQPTLRAILDRFSDAKCVLACAVQSIEQYETLVQQQVCLHHAVKLLDQVYDELDRACMAAGGAK
jgi:hypothetical protein